MAANVNIGYHISLDPENVWDNLVLVVEEGVKEDAEEAIGPLWSMNSSRSLELPDGYETHLGRAGYGLSGGQRQWLALIWNPSAFKLLINTG